MADPRISLKKPVLAAILAFLIPGAGHLYQKRTFKAILYSVCILGTFFCGMWLGDWKTVYNSQRPGRRTIGYYAQVGVGLPALYALVQTSRYGKKDNISVNSLEKPLSTSFIGKRVDRIRNDDDDGDSLVGTIELKPAADRHGEIQGIFTGTVNGEPSEEIRLGGQFFLAKKVLADQRRKLRCDIVDENGRPGTTAIEGTIPRSFFDWFEAPLEDKPLEKLEAKLGKQFELAKVFTWIAGLLNILAVWDALEGPAYGYGDEEEEDDDEKKKKKEKESENAAEKSETQPAAS